MGVFTTTELHGGYPAESDGFRPTEWSTTGASADSQQLVYLRTNIGGYFFDAILREEHSTALRITEHPVQSGSNISDHAYQLPAQIMMEIGVSDVMSSFTSGQFTGGESKSVNAYKNLLQLQKDRTPFDIVTRLNSYSNMLVEHIMAPDDHRLSTSLRALVIFKQVILASVASTTVTDSSAEQTTNSTNKGNVQTVEPNAATTDNWLVGAYGESSYSVAAEAEATL